MDYVVIMAGGTGKRLWPLSRKARPKQVLKLFNGQTLLSSCFNRLSPIFSPDKIIVLTNAAYVDTVRENLPDVPANNVIAEPAVRDTAGAIGLAAAILTKRDPDASMAVVTADQLIEPAEVLQQAIKDALAFVNANPTEFLTFGIKPTFPNTQLGYIKCGESSDSSVCKNPVYAVEAFKEKPDAETAAQYVDSGKYLWNSGMFVWKAAAILETLQKHLPEAAEPLDKIKADWDTPNQQKSLQKWFLKLPKISIDYAVMEKAKNVHAIELNCRWLDMGAFTALADFIKPDKDKNIIAAATNQLLDCKNSIVVTEDDGHLIAAIGLENIIIAHTPDATLICHTDQAQRIKELLTLISEQGGEEFL